MNKQITDKLIEKISDVCRQEEAIVAVYLFGSFASEKMRPGSDIDIGLLLEPGKEDAFLLLELAASLERACDCPVDLVLLNHAGEVLKYRVRRNGYLIFERDPGMRKQFEVLGRKLFEDFLYLHKRYIRSVLYKNS